MDARRMAVMMCWLDEIFGEFGEPICYRQIEIWMSRGCITTPEAHTLRAYVDSCVDNENAEEVGE